MHAVSLSLSPPHSISAPHPPPCLFLDLREHSAAMTHTSTHDF